MAYSAVELGQVVVSICFCNGRLCRRRHCDTVPEPSAACGVATTIQSTVWLLHLLLHSSGRSRLCIPTETGAVGWDIHRHMLVGGCAVVDRDARNDLAPTL